MSHVVRTWNPKMRSFWKLKFRRGIFGSSAGTLSITGRYWQMVLTPGTRAMGLLCTGGIGAVMACALAIVLVGLPRWVAAMRAPPAPAAAR